MRIRRVRGIGGLILLGGWFFGTAVAAQAGTWIQDGGSLNLQTDRQGQTPAIAVASDGTPYVAIRQFDGAHWQIYLRAFQNGAWTTQGTYVNNDPTHDAGSFPTLALSPQDVPYVVWIEDDLVRVKRFVGGVWQAVGSSLNNNPPSAPVIAFNGETPYVTWLQDETGADNLFMSHYNGASWVPDGNGLNNAVTQEASGPDLAMFAGAPWVAFAENNGSATQIFVKDFSLNTWVMDGGGPLNVVAAHGAQSPRLAVANNMPYVMWIETNSVSNQTYVKHLENGAWVIDGRSLNLDSYSNSRGGDLAAGADGALYAAWCEGAVHTAYVKGWVRDDWVLLGGALNLDSGHHADWIRLGVAPSGTVYAVWCELNAGGIYQVYVKHYLPDPPPTPAFPEQVSAATLAVPNPARGRVTILWQETGASAARVKIYNGAGEAIATLLAVNPGRSLVWNAAGIAPGIYFYEVTITVNGTDKKLPRGKLALLKP